METKIYSHTACCGGVSSAGCKVCRSVVGLRRDMVFDIRPLLYFLSMLHWVSWQGDGFQAVIATDAFGGGGGGYMSLAHLIPPCAFSHIRLSTIHHSAVPIRT